MDDEEFDNIEEDFKNITMEEEKPKATESPLSKVVFTGPVLWTGKKNRTEPDLQLIRTNCRQLVATGL